MFTGFYKNFKNQFKFKLLYPNRIDNVHAFDKSTSIGECYNIVLLFIKTNYEYVLNYFFVTFSQQHLTETLSSPEWKLYAWLAAIYTLEMLLYDVLF